MNKEWINKIQEYFFPSNASSLNIDAAMKLLYENLPRKLFKYRKINNFSKNNLQEDTVRLSCANEFNDPYDSAISFDLLSTFSDKKSGNIFDSLIACADRVLKKAKLAPSMRDNFQNAWKTAIGNEEVRMIKHLSSSMQSGLKICSFSERIDSLLMWSHYSKDHTGFAIEYDFGALPPSDIRTRILWPVIYDEALFDATKFINPAIKHKHKLNPFWGIFASMHKAKDWQYEKEWRLILADGPNEPPYNYKVPTPKAIYLGSKISDDDKEALVQIATQKGINIFKMKLAHNQFKMEPEPVL